MFKKFVAFIILLFLLLRISADEYPSSTNAPDPITERTDEKFIDYLFPPLESEYDWYEGKHYSNSGWKDLIERKVNLSNFDDVRQKLVTRLGEYGLLLTDADELIYINERGINKTLWLGNMNRARNIVLHLYTMGMPIYNGQLFYQIFNRDTKAAIEKRLPFSHYNYSLEYALIDSAFENGFRRFKNKVTMFYRGIRSDFTYQVNDKFRFNQWTSTSTKSSVALGFLAEGGTLFAIFGADVLSISDVSMFPSEEEYLIHPFMEFNVDAVRNLTVPAGSVTYVELRRLKRYPFDYSEGW